MNDREPGSWPASNRRFKSPLARTRAFNVWARREQRRIAAQREIIAKVFPTEVRAELERAMIERAEQLLNAGHPGAADQLLEFVSAELADEFLRLYFEDDEEPIAND